MRVQILMPVGGWAVNQSSAMILPLYAGAGRILLPTKRRRLAPRKYIGEINNLFYNMEILMLGVNHRSNSKSVTLEIAESDLLRLPDTPPRL